MLRCAALTTLFLLSLVLWAEEGIPVGHVSLLVSDPARYSSGVQRDYCDFLRNAPGHETISLPLSIYGVAARGPALWQDRSLAGECAPIGYVRSFTAWVLDPAFAVAVVDGDRLINPLRGKVWSPHELVASGTLGELNSNPCSLAFVAHLTMPARDAILSSVEIRNNGAQSLHLALVAFGGHPGFTRSPGYICRDPKVPRRVQVVPAEGLVQTRDTFPGLFARDKQFTFYSAWLLDRAPADGVALQAAPVDAARQVLRKEVAQGQTEVNVPNNCLPISFVLSFPLDLKAGDSIRFSLALGLSTTDQEEARSRAKEALSHGYAAAAADTRNMWNTLLSNGPQLDGDDRLAQLYYSCVQTLFQATVPAGAELFDADSLVPDAKYNYIGHWQWDEIMAIVGMRFVYPAFVDSILESQFAASPEAAGQCTNTAWQIWKTYEITGDQEFLARFYDRAVAQVDGTMKTFDPDSDGLRRASSGLIGESDQTTLRKTDHPRSVVGVGDAAHVLQDYRSLAQIARVLGRETDAERFEASADSIRDAANAKLWDAKTGTYRVMNEKTEEHLDILAGDAFAAFFGAIPDREKAQALFTHLFNTNEFWTEAPIPTIAVNDPHFLNGWWDGGVWMYLNYPVIEGLRMHGYAHESRRLRERVLEALFKHGPQEAWGCHSDWTRGWAYTETAGHTIDVILSRLGVRTDGGTLSFKDIELPARSVSNLIFHGTRFDVMMKGGGESAVATPTSLLIDDKRIEGNAVPDEFCDKHAHRIDILLRTVR